MMQPVLEDVASRLGDAARVAKVDTDKSPRLGSRYRVEALPTLVLFHKGKNLCANITDVAHLHLGQEVERFVGYRSADDLEKEVRGVSLFLLLVLAFSPGSHMHIQAMKRLSL
jgi:thioredoxin-like negative regulator of GroEL